MTVTTSTDNGVKTYTSSAASLTDTSTSSLSQKTLDQTDFLRLLTTQLQAQDPLNPVSNADLVAQMATITTTSGISAMGDSLNGISDMISSMKDDLGASRLSDAANWIGHSMLVTSDKASPNAAGDYSGQFSIDAASDDVQVKLVDGSGNTVKTLDLGAQDKGTVTYYWDGKDESGNYVAGDTYSVQVSGATASDKASYASIVAVQSPGDSSSSKLITALGTFSPSDAQKLI